MINVRIVAKTIDFTASIVESNGGMVGHTTGANKEGGANKEEVKKSVDVVETTMGEHAAAAAHKENEGKPATTRVQCLPIGVPIFEAMASTILQEF